MKLFWSAVVMAVVAFAPDRAGAEQLRLLPHHLAWNDASVSAPVQCAPEPPEVEPPRHGSFGWYVLEGSAALPVELAAYGVAIVPWELAFILIGTQTSEARATGLALQTLPFVFSLAGGFASSAIVFLLTWASGEHPRYWPVVGYSLFVRFFVNAVFAAITVVTGQEALVIASIGVGALAGTVAEVIAANTEPRAPTPASLRDTPAAPQGAYALNVLSTSF